MRSTSNDITITTVGSLGIFIQGYISYKNIDLHITKCSNVDFIRL